MEERSDNRGVRALLLVLLIGFAQILFSLGDHPFYGRSDVRYAEVSREMAEHDQWLVPQKRGKAHLTKPPLVYWMEAGAMKVLGANELAARLPSALAGCATLSILAALAWKRHGWDTALFATAMLAVMPLHVVVSRLPLTDGVLGCFWFATLACGLLAVEEPRRRTWPVLLWTAVALAFFTKGPQALIPVAVLLTWLALAGRWREIRSLRLGWGLPLSAVPLAAWVITILSLYPGTYHLWIGDLFGRDGQTAIHPQPWWYYLPLVLCGLFPAVLTLRTPGISMPVREALARLRGGDDRALWLLAILIPLVGFSLRSGKLITYMLPLCAPAAMLGGITLRRWLSGAYDSAVPRWAPRPWTLLLCVLLGSLGLGITVVLIGPPLVAKYAARSQGDGQAIVSEFRHVWVMTALLAASAVAAAAQWWSLRKSASGTLCRWAMACAWGSIAVIGLGIAEAEDQVLALTRIREVASEARQIAAQEHAPVLLFGTNRLSLDFYLQQDSRPVSLAELRQVVVEPQPLCIVADKHALDALRGRDAQLLEGFEQTPVLNPVPADKPLCILWRSAARSQVPQPAELHARR